MDSFFVVFCCICVVIILLLFYYYNGWLSSAYKSGNDHKVFGVSRINLEYHLSQVTNVLCDLLLYYSLTRTV